MNRKTLILVMILMLITAACQSVNEGNTSDNGNRVTVALESQSNDSPRFAHVELTNARTGEAFTLVDFVGKTVFVHPMATWCSDCLVSQTKIADHIVPNLVDEDVVFVSISNEVGLDDSDLALYADDFGFGWIFAVATSEMIDALIDTFGRSVIVSPSQPHFILGTNGIASQLYLGSPPPQEYINRIQAAS